MSNICLRQSLHAVAKHRLQQLEARLTLRRCRYVMLSMQWSQTNSTWLTLLRWTLQLFADSFYTKPSQPWNIRKWGILWRLFGRKIRTVHSWTRYISAGSTRSKTIVSTVEITGRVTTVHHRRTKPLFSEMAPATIKTITNKFCVWFLLFWTKPFWKSKPEGPNGGRQRGDRHQSEALITRSVKALHKKSSPKSARTPLKNVSTYAVSKREKCLEQVPPQGTDVDFIPSNKKQSSNYTTPNCQESRNNDRNEITSNRNEDTDRIRPDSKKK